VVDFAPGLTDLSDESRGRLDTLAKALGERPGLTLLLLGGADGTADPDALRQARLEALVREEKWRAAQRREREAVAAGSLTVDSGEYPRFLKRALKTFQAAHPQEDEDTKPETPAEIEAWMLERIEIPPADLAALAAARARAVRDHLAASGVAAERLLVNQDAAGEAARVTLELQ